ncbi:MAG TPA: zf-HC2 domain-containing protein [Chthonomonadaceae bacterium]|nr:zf-HC2 domain-containing protein [Chthonomonadaceae bacterium]
MQCEHAQELFSDYLAGEMDRALAVSMENHLAACAVCREEVAGLRRVWSALDEMPVVDPPPHFHEDLMRRLEVERAPVVAMPRPQTWDWRALFRPRQLAYAATVLIFLLAGAEVIQSRRAELGPISWILQSLHATHAVRANATFQSEGAQWQPGMAGGALVIRLRTPENADTSGLTYKVNVDGNTTALHAAERSDQEVLLTLPLSAPPTAKSITVTIPAANGDTDAQTVVVPVQSSAPAPTAP